MNIRVDDNAFEAPNGELAWLASYVFVAIETIRQDNLAILGGEVWVVINGAVRAMPPLADGGTAVIAWNTNKPASNESWREFVDRAAKETVLAIKKISAEETVAREVRDKVYYNLCYVSEAEYKELRS